MNHSSPSVHCLIDGEQWAADVPLCTASLLGSSGQWKSCNALPHRRGAVGSGTSAIHCHTIGEHWAVGLLQYTATPLGSRRQWISFSTRNTTREQWALGLLQYTASPLGSIGRWVSFSTLPQRTGAVGSGCPSVYSLTTREHWAVGLLLYIASRLLQNKLLITQGIVVSVPLLGYIVYNNRHDTGNKH